MKRLLEVYLSRVDGNNATINAETDRLIAGRVECNMGGVWLTYFGNGMLIHPDGRKVDVNFAMLDGVRIKAISDAPKAVEAPKGSLATGEVVKDATKVELITNQVKNTGTDKPQDSKKV